MGSLAREWLPAGSANRREQVQDDDVCVGAVALEGPIIANAFRKVRIGSRTSQLMCITFLGLCDYPAVTPWSVPFPSPKPATRRPTPSGRRPPIKVVHYSDIHIDHGYVAGANANCSKPICCRSYTESDSPGKNAAPAGPNGDHNCDTPVSLEASMYAAITKVAPDAAFAIFTGDIIDHAVWLTTKEENVAHIDHAYASMAQSGLPFVYGTAGNHEAHPTNAFPPDSAANRAAQYVYDALSTAWARWIGATSTGNGGTARRFGAYSTKYPGGNLRIISLSTNMYYIQNFWLYEEPQTRDPNGQLAWLVSELDAAEKAGERVYIIGHMPMGNKDAFHDGSNFFDQIVNRYEATIAAMFFGHTHRDHFAINYADYSAPGRSARNAAVVSYIAPSLAPTSGMPSFRVYDVDPETFAVLDHTTYIADMTDPSFQNTSTGPVWKKYYSAKEAYGTLLSPPVTSSTEELTPAFWHNVTLRLEADQAAFDAYYARKSRGWNTAAPGQCTGDCKAREICGLRGGRAQDNCFEPKPGLHIGFRRSLHDDDDEAFGKRGVGADEYDEYLDLSSMGHHDECGLSITRAIVAQLATRKDALEILERRVVLERRAALEEEKRRGEEGGVKM